MTLFPPRKKHIEIITNLVKLGCNEPDICLVLNIPEATLKLWKDRSKTLSDILKPKARPEFTILHPDFAPMVEEAFACGGKRFYRFKEEYRMATGRYKYYYACLREVEMKASLETLTKYVDAFELILNGGGKAKTIQIGKLWELLINLKSRIALAFDPKTVRELASVAYFDETEDITSFDKKYGDEKIKLWDSHNLYDFFLMKPIGELFNLSSISAASLEEHFKVMSGVITDLNSNLQTVVEDNL